MQEQRKSQIEQRVKTYLQLRGQRDPNIRGMTEKILTDQGLFYKVVGKVLELGAGNKEVSSVFKGSGEPSQQDMQKVGDFLAANWDAGILPYLKTLFVGDTLQLKDE